MAKYEKPWLSLDEQLERLEQYGLLIPDKAECLRVLGTIGYYRLSGYLYPFRQSERHTDDDGVERTRILSGYRPETNVRYAFQLINFDRALRMLVLEATERIEIALRMRIGYVLGESSPFAHEMSETFLDSFTADTSSTQLPGGPLDVAQTLFPTEYRSKHRMWMERVAQRRNDASDSFVKHFSDKYDGKLPIWALTEILEMGHLSRLYGGLKPQFAIPIAEAFNVPTKTIMVSWLASLNYTRNAAAHHARLFNRKLQSAPSRPKIGVVPVLDHLTSDTMPKSFGVYNILAVMAYLMSHIDPLSDWNRRIAALADAFPQIEGMDIAVVGFPRDWREHSLWT